MNLQNDAHTCFAAYPESGLSKCGNLFNFKPDLKKQHLKITYEENRIFIVWALVESSCL
jgi:hypothetical protein